MTFIALQLNQLYVSAAIFSMDDEVRENITPCLTKIQDYEFEFEINDDLWKQTLPLLQQPEYASSFLLQELFPEYIDELRNPILNSSIFFLIDLFQMICDVLARQKAIVSLFANTEDSFTVMGKQQHETETYKILQLDKYFIDDFDDISIPIDSILLYPSNVFQLKHDSKCLHPNDTMPNDLLVNLTVFENMQNANVYDLNEILKII